MPVMERWIMVADLAAAPDEPRVPTGCTLDPWGDAWLRPAAEVLHQAYRGSPESRLYPELGSAAGCVGLLRRLLREKALLPAATGLLARRGEPLATLLAAPGSGGGASIEHVGVLPAERGHGLAAALLGWSLARLRAAGFARAELHVTAENAPAVRLYRRAGFEILGVYQSRVP